MKQPIQSLIADIILISIMVACSFFYGNSVSSLEDTTSSTSDTSLTANKSNLITSKIPLNIYANNSKHPIFSGTTGSLGIGNAYTSLQSLLHIYEFGNNNNNTIISMVMKTIQDQQKIIDSLKIASKKFTQTNQDSINKVMINQNTLLKTQIDQLTSAINACCNAKNNMKSSSNSGNPNSLLVEDQTTINLQDLKTPILGQNAPDPFTNQTIITYFIPDSVAQAQILIYNLQGKIIQTLDLNQRGKGSIYINAQDLTNGIYNYTLMIDGRSIGFKKMVRQ